MQMEALFTLLLSFRLFLPSAWGSARGTNSPGSAWGQAGSRTFAHCMRTLTAPHRSSSTYAKERQTRSAALRSTTTSMRRMRACGQHKARQGKARQGKARPC